MPQRREKKGPSAKDRRPIKKKTSILSSESIDWVDYKDVNLLRRFMSERAKIRARRVTGNSAQQQRAVARAIRIAREMALLPYSVRQVTQRKGGRRDRGDRGELRDEGAPRSPREPEAIEADYVELEVDDMPDGVEITEIDEVEAVESEGAEA